MTNGQPSLAVAVAVGSALALAGCAAAQESPIAQEYREMSSKYESFAEEAQKVADCVEQSTGFVVDVGRDGSLGASTESIPNAQMDLVFEEIDRCQGYPNLEPELQFSDEALGRLYDLQLEARKCFIGEGYIITEPPSKATFIDTFQSDDQFWNLGMELALVHKLSPDEQMDLKEKCADPLDFLDELSEIGAD